MRKALLPFLLLLLFTSSGFSQSTPALGHVVVVAFENHSYSQVVGSSAMPYLNGLISQYALATGYYANTHPSIGNYLELTTGQIITNNDGYTSTISVDNLERRLIGAGKTWKSYAQSIPSTGYLGGDQYPYIKHHNPFAFFSDNVGSSQANHIVPFSQFATDINNGALPNFSFIAPDQHHNAHDCPAGMSTCTDADMLNAADQFLQYSIAPVLNSAQFQKDGVLVIWWDEGVSSDTANGGGHVAITLVGPSVKRGYKSSTFYKHQNLLRTVAESLGVGFPGASSSAASMAEFFTTSSSSGTGSIVGHVTDITTGSAISGAAVKLSGGASTTTNSSGYYSFSTMASGSYTVTASASGYFAESTATSVTAGSTNTANVQLPTGGILAGTVTGSNGAALANATVSISGGKVATTKSMTTNSTGGYNTSWIPVGTYTVSVSASGYATQSKTTTVNTGATTTLNVSMSGTSTSSTATVTGRITDISSGGAVAGASVTMGSSSTTANSTGYYTFSNVAAGTYSVTAVASGYFSRSQSVTATAGTTSTLNLQLATGGIVAGTVTASSGSALANASVTLSGGSVATTKTVTSGSGGSYSSSWVPVGTYTVTVSASGYTSQTKTVAATTGTTATLNFALSPTTATPAPVSHSATLNWSAEPAVVGYNVYRSSQSGGPYTRLNSTLASSTSFTDTSVSAGQSYYYVTTAVNSSSIESGYSSQIKAVIPTP